MKKFDRKDFEIQFSGLKDGLHHFTFKIESLFFEQYDLLSLYKGDVSLECELDKKTEMLVLKTALNGELTGPCDRCGSDTEFNIGGNFKLIFKFSDEEHYEEDEIVYLPLNAHKLNLSDFFYEFIDLSIPQKNVHTNSECNPDVVDFIDGFDDEEETKDNDPRWDQLKNLKF